MLREEVDRYFEIYRRKLYNSRLSSSDAPKAILLGGQGAVGKGTLTETIKRSSFSGITVLSINGDEYRQFHPNFHSLIKDDLNFSRETQIFSNVFTERLIETGIQNRFNMIIEGTMRNPNTPLKTAKMLKDNGYTVEAYVIAAPKEFSSINAFYRYTRELQNQGWGRLADMRSHDAAVDGLPKSLDIIQQSGLVDRIRIFSMFAKELGADYIKGGDNKWNIVQKPSKTVELMRERQLADVNNINRQLQNGQKALTILPEPLKSQLKDYIQHLESIKIKVDRVNDLDISGLTIRNIQDKWLLTATINGKPLSINGLDKENVVDFKQKNISERQLLLRLSDDDRLKPLVNVVSNTRHFKM